MNFPEAIAFSALMIGMISAAGIWLDGYKRRLTNREKELELQVRLAEAEGEYRAGRMPNIEERLRVLERIATDGTAPLAERIEALRGAEAEKVQ